MTAALKLKKNYILLEKQSFSGGLCDTVEDNGFRFDKTGHLLHLSDNKVRKLVFELLGDRLLELKRDSRIFSKGVYTHYPFQANTHGLPLEITAECLSGFVKAYAARGGVRVGAQTFEEFILTNFGDGIAKHFMIPYNAKLWGVHPSEITDEWCNRFVPTPCLDEVISGALGRPANNIGYNASFYYPPRGIGELSSAMAARLDNIRFGSSPSLIDVKHNRLFVDNTWLPYRALISSLPLDQIVNLIDKVPAKVKKAAALLWCTKLRYLDVALRVPVGTRFHWSYVPERKYPFYRVGSYSNFSAQMVPKGKGSLYVELASRSRINLDRLMPKVISGLVEMGIIKKESDVEFVRPKLIEHAYVVYDKHYSKSKKTVMEWLEEHSIFSAGRYARWEYAAMEDAVSQGINAANLAMRV